GVMLGVFRMAKAVEDNQYERFFGRGHTQSSLLQSRGGGILGNLPTSGNGFSFLLPIGECGLFYPVKRMNTMSMTEKYPMHGVYCRPSLRPVTDIRVIVLVWPMLPGFGGRVRLEEF